ncbi:hypothetical protein K435DRAFT_854004 [Dendrothele bispora CBS 962.96]|uniref:Uncharacterized protein n=1 Tax=Dendrothele bispora (strain CBS 962.96) TaxID=1314807 RepID=A0A4S8MFE2_DENBC|nr:hypothetical protein K435DRAFT_854004 [Dendrothele bispora CBS 962.96]
MDNKHESVEVLELKLKLLQAKKVEEDSVEVLELKIKLAAAKNCESKSSRKTSSKSRKKNDSSSSSSSKTKKTKTNENTNPSGGTTRTAIIRWSDKTKHHITDSLLGFIEDSASLRQTYGFDRGNFSSSANNSGGKRQADFDRELATKLFLDINVVKTNKYKEFGLDALGSCVRNRITALKKAYIEHRNTMSQTGHGIVVNGQEETIQAGSEIANAWDAVKTVFPWYRRMALLIGGSPVVDRSAVANSTTNVDLSVLQDTDDIEQSIEEQVLGDIPLNETWDVENPQDYDEGIGLDNSSQIDPPSPSHDVPIDPSLPCATSSNPTDLRPASAENRGQSNTAPAPSSTVEPLSKKRKLSMAESLQETIATSRQSILQAHNLKQKTRVEIEEHRLAFERKKELNQQEAQRLELEDRKAAREHERAMMEASLELERLRRGLSQ